MPLSVQHVVTNEYHTSRHALVAFFFFFLTLLLSSFWTSRGHKGVVPSLPRFLPSIFIAHRVQQSHCSSSCFKCLLTQALALSASQSGHKKKSQRSYTSTSKYALGGARTYETDLYQARGQPDTPSGRPVSIYFTSRHTLSAGGGGVCDT